MKIILAVIIGALLVASVAAQQTSKDPKKDFRNYMYCDGACYLMEKNKEELPEFLEGYWGYASVSFEPESVISFTIKNELKQVFLAKPVPNKDARQCIALKKVNGYLKAFLLVPSTDEQLKKALADKKAYYYGGLVEVVDGYVICKNCGGKGCGSGQVHVNGKVENRVKRLEIKTVE